MQVTPKKPPARYLPAVFLLLTDLLGLILSFSISYQFRFGEMPQALGFSLIWPVVLTLFSLYVLDVYRTDTQVAGMRAPVRTITAVILATFLTAIVAYLGGYWSTNQFFGRGVFPVAMLLFAAWSATWRFLMYKWTKHRAGLLRWLVLGTGEPSRQLWRDFRQFAPEAELIFLSTNEKQGDNSATEDMLPVAAAVDDLAAWGNMRCSGIIVAMPPPLPEALVQKLMALRLNGLPVYDLADFYEHSWSKVPVFHLRDGWFVFSHGFDLLQNPLGLRTKRVLDVVFSLLLLVLLLPVMGAVALLIKLDSGGPVIYRQLRTGEGGKIFTIYKFRSMRVDAEKNGAQWASSNDSRVTRIGRLLRITRLDEFPQLINVIRGDMSFIGPRPERPEFNRELEQTIPYYELRNLVKPGVTGWAQVMYPYGASVEDAREKLQYDLYYIKNYSLLLDVAILFKTLRVVFLGKGR